MSILIWTMVGLAVWHFVVFLPDRFYGGIIGAFLASWFGAMVSGFLLPIPGLPSDNPPGVGEALWAFPGSVVALAVCFAVGTRIEARDGEPR